MIRVVFDTNVLFSAVFKSVGIPAQTVDLVTHGMITPCTSDAVMDEYRDVLTRPVLRPHGQRAAEVFALLSRFAVHVSPTETLDLCPDPDDNRFLECAAEADAEYLVTGNIKHFPATYEHVAVVTPRMLLQEILSRHKKK